jgi:hypoxanthine phosphoribosyltransferase
MFVGMRVLITDDVADTGKTLELVRNPDQGPRPVRKRRDY